MLALYFSNSSNIQIWIIILGPYIRGCEVFQCKHRSLQFDMKLGRMSMRAYQIGPTDTIPLAWDRLTGSALGQGKNALEQADLLLHFPLLIRW